MSDSYLVRTVFLQNYFAPSAELAKLRRNEGDMQAMVGAMKRTELASQTLEKELNAFADKGYQIVSILQHPRDSEHPHDLFVTVVLSKAN
ncbi:MAG: hypothetical protein AAFV98_02860 [Chloroflexota bacterium]